MRLSFQPEIPDHVKELVLALEQSVLDGRVPESDILEQLPEEAFLGSPLLLRAGSIRLIMEGQLQEAREWVQAAIRGYAVQADHVEMLSMIGLLTLLYVRIGDFTETETLLQFLEDEGLRSPEACGGFVWWALARGKSWNRMAPVIQSLSPDAYFGRAADSFAEAGDAASFGHLLLDCWLYDGSCMQLPEWQKRLNHLRQWGALRRECDTVLRAISGETLPQEALMLLPSRFAYMVGILQSTQQWNSTGPIKPPASDLKYDVEIQLFASRANVTRKLTTGERTEAAMSLRQMELMAEEMSTPRTAGWVEELRGKLSSPSGYVPLMPNLSFEDEPLPGTPQDGADRLRIQLMGGIRLLSLDGTVLTPKWKRKRSKELLVYLLLQPDFRAIREQVIDELFGDGDPTKLANHLYVSLHELRSALAALGFEDAVEARGGIIGFRESVVEVVDVGHYMTLSKVGDDLWTDDREEAFRLYQDAVRLYGLLGADMPQLDWLVRWREQLLERQTQMLRRLGEYYAASTDDSHTEKWLSAWIELRPDQEEAYQEMIRYWLKRGRRAEALSWYRRLEKKCREELGTEPLAETKRLLGEV
ncbi:AfsR/SARP family transcriptional regulator [Paenibacillus tarimensis]|uniref:AfsR/SARP family transcriptional regulator n=1 Tax=Paenibacillus tarimensis TaxID=416012 RepID=UPI001F35287F|nr:BTAD domain-containing putative transcriptional regulator [Paenibacillus tarimensis]MCF2944080.1 hypothetical protein [Paenibacillus tarimensis]